MAVEKIKYQAGGKNFIGTLVYDEKVKTRRPLMLMAPNWLGVTEDAIKRTAKMAGDKFIGFVADMYGDGRIASGPPEAGPLANMLRADFKERRLRISAALSTLVAEADRRGIGEAGRKAAIGFCFGGGNVLELARTGADVQAVVCLHGDLNTPAPAKAGDIKSAILVLHGSVDPVSPRSQRDELEAELDGAKAKWQMLMFGGLIHSFSEIETSMPGFAEYNEAAARQSYKMLDEFIADAFTGRL